VKILHDPQCKVKKMKLYASLGTTLIQKIM